MRKERLASSPKIHLQGDPLGPISCAYSAIGGALGQALRGQRPTPAPKAGGDIFELMGEARWDGSSAPE